MFLDSRKEFYRQRDCSGMALNINLVGETDSHSKRIDGTHTFRSNRYNHRFYNRAVEFIP